jgi:hypothetical protein
LHNEEKSVDLHFIVSHIPHTVDASDTVEAESSCAYTNTCAEQIVLSKEFNHSIEATAQHRHKRIYGISTQNSKLEFKIIERQTQ